MCADAHALQERSLTFLFAVGRRSCSSAAAGHAAAGNRCSVRLQQAQRYQRAGAPSSIVKPSPGAADWPLQGGTSTHAHMDAWALAAHAAAAPWALPLSPRLVHRLDKGSSPASYARTFVCQAYLTWQPVSSRSSDTSGVLVMAKGRSAMHFHIYRLLQLQYITCSFRQRVS